MANKVLYFPYIRVPQSAWFTRVLLYWDEVGAIVPYDYVEDPGRLGQYAGDLVRAGLVKQIIPGVYLSGVPEFEKSFLDYLNGLGPRLDDRRLAFERSASRTRIHVEKMQSLTNSLVKLRLAQPLDFSWFNVETKTARDFMGYLAAVLGRHEEYTPITDNPVHLSEFVNASTNSPVARLARLRLDVLEDLLPAPRQPLGARDLENFKNRHANLLRDFRRAIEKELISVADIHSEELRAERLRIFREEIEEKLSEVKVRMGESGWPDLVLGKVCAVAGAVPGASSLFGLASAVFHAFQKSAAPLDSQPLLYAAYAQEEFLSAAGHERESGCSGS